MREEQILNDLKNKLPKVEIQNKYNVSKSWLYRFSKKNGFVNKATSAEKSKENKEKAIKLYLEGYTRDEIGSKLNYSPSTVSQWITDEGVSKTNYYSEEFKEMVVQEYVQGFDSTELSNKHDLNKGTLMDWVRKRGKSRLSGPDTKIGNVNYFDIIDSEEKAYWLGYIMADGSVSLYNNQYSLKLTTQKNDANTIKDFLESINSTNKIYYGIGNYLKVNGEYNEYARCSLTSKHMISRLIELGVVPNKSGKEKIPAEIKGTNLEKHFIRGYFDGDGTVSYNEETGVIKVVIYTASKDMISDFNKYMKIEREPYFLNNCYSIHLRKKEIDCFYNDIYKNSTISMKRKEKLFNNYYSVS